MFEQNLHKWVFKFSEEKRKRIVIEYLPFEDKYVFIGQIRPRQIGEWLDYSKYSLDTLSEVGFVSAIEFIEADLNLKENRIEEMDKLYEYFKDHGIKLIENNENN